MIMISLFLGLVSVSFFKNFDGDVSIFVPLDDVKKLLGWDGGSDRKITVRGSVTEEVTGVTFNETVSVDVKESKIKVEALYKPNTIKPGLSYTAYVSDAGLQCYFNHGLTTNHVTTFASFELFWCKFVFS